MHDIVIRGGTIIDGTGKAAFTGDVAIADGRITAVGGSKALPSATSPPRDFWSRRAGSMLILTMTARRCGTHYWHRRAGMA